MESGHRRADLATPVPEPGDGVTGTLPVTRVPWAGAESTRRQPPNMPSRSAMSRNPAPGLEPATSNPVPSSATSNVSVPGSSVYGNTADFGAGLYNNDGTESVIRSTVERNTASGQGGGIYIVNAGTMTLTRSAVESNTADGGPGSGGGIYKSSGTVTLDHSWARKNSPDNCAPTGSVPGCFG